MIRAWLFLHLLGFTMWIGGALGVMVAGIAGRREDRSALAAIVRAQSLVYLVVGPGALLAVLSGILLTFRNSGTRFAGADLWLILMQGAGALAALLTLLISLPTASKLGRLDPMGKTGPYFDELRSRQKLVSTISGILAVTALVAGMMLVHGG